MLIIIVRSVILYLLIVFSLRLMGKKQLAQLQPSELVTTILISNIATLSLEDSSIPMMYGIIPILMIVCLDVFTSYLLLKSSHMRRLFTGTPQIIISDGIIDQRMMKSLRYSIDELNESMREAMIFDITEVQYAIVETTGKINFYQKSKFRGVQNGDMNIQLPNGDPPYLLIKDGQINKPVIQRWDGGPERLDRILKVKSLTLKDVFLMTYDEQNGAHIVMKEKAGGKIYDLPPDA
ncbi:MAG: DUF421 domain-containing protein [Eubacterium sp.]|nr:DUF421 domain-containing protein [Eubacterium sp.]